MTPSRIRHTKTVDGVTYFRHQCMGCRIVTAWTTKTQMHCACSQSQSPELLAELFPKESRALLFGDRIKQLTDALGIPQCGGCEKRQEWLNKAHEWVLKRWAS